MNWAREWQPLAAILGVFLACYFLPVEWLQASGRVESALWEALHLARWYAQEHVLLCLVPAFFIAGAVGVFVSQAAVMKYLGPRANTVIAYGVASVSGTILAVCSCTILPLFAGIYRMGAGLGPACAFLYSGPAINVLAIILTARVLGLKMGVARAVGAIVFLSAVNAAGVRFGAWVQNAFTLLKLAALALLVAAGAWLWIQAPGGEGALAAAAASGAPAVAASPAGFLLAMGTALVAVLFAYGGWQHANNVAEEIREPERRLPLALVVGVGIYSLYIQNSHL
jgi:uncharacterized membrane protein YraQ (UPF0718 family)